MGDHFTIGERIAFYRRRRGMTQSVLAGLVSRSEDWLSKVERNKRDIRRLDVLTDVARALRVELGDLLGAPVLTETPKSTGDDIPAVRDALMSHRRLSRTLFGADDPRQTNPAEVAVFATRGLNNYQDGHFGQVIESLPGLIISAQTLEDADSTDGLMVAARIYHLCASTLAKIGESDLSWIAAERAMEAAEKSGSSLALASAARVGTHALLVVGRFDDAIQLGETAAEWLSSQAKDNDAEGLSIMGMLYLRTAIAAARRQDRGTTRELLDRAEHYAARLGHDDNHWHTMFGPTNVALHRVSAALDLGDVAWALEHGPGIDASHLGAERHTTHRIDLARAYSWTACDDEALEQLLEAENLSPQIVRSSVVARDTVKALHRRGHTHGTNRDLLRLAEQCRAIQ